VESAQLVDYDSPCANRVVVLNAIISPKVKALLIPVISLHFLNLSFSCMIDCGSSHCFINSHYAKVNHFLIVSVPQMRLRLIDGSSPSYIMRATDIFVRFSCGTIHQVRFLITRLDTKFSAVLRLDWLTLHNPLINWADSSVTFRDHPDTLPVTTTQSVLANQEELPSGDDTSSKLLEDHLILILLTFRNQLLSLSQTQLLIQFLFPTLLWFPTPF
jgi:Retroviral aspartyl protease